MLFALGFIAQFTIGGLSGVMHSIVPSDTQQTDTYFVVAHFHYVLFGGLVFAVFGGFYYWWPKVFGKMLNEKLGKLNFWLMVVGFNLTFFPMHFLGFEGQPRRTYTYPSGMGWDTLNLLATIGAFIIATSVLVFLVNVIFTSPPRASGSGTTRGTARTLEWSIPSPPPEYNFAVVPVVTSLDDYWHRKYTEDDEGRLVRLPTGGAGDEEELIPAGFDPHSIHMPSPSYWPLIFALSLPIMGYGFVFKNWYLLAAGVLVAFFGLNGWAIEPSTEPDDHGAPPLPGTPELDGGALMTQAVVSAGHAEIEPGGIVEHGHDTNTGVSNSKVGIWLFLSSEALFFGAFISTYFLYRGRDAQFLKGPTPDKLLNIPFTSVTSFVLLMSSLTMVLALAAIQRGDHAAAADLAARHVLVRRHLRRRSGVRVHRVLPPGSAPRHEHVRHDVLRADRSARRPRHHRHHLAAVALGSFGPGPAAAGEVGGDRDRRALLALRRRGVDLHLHRDLSDPDALRTLA